jgi:prepilin-type processing-associated H-X9-DG protein
VNGSLRETRCRSGGDCSGARSDWPGCAYSKFAAPRGPWGFDGRETKADQAAAPKTHYPARHVGVFNVLFCDGHVESMGENELMKELFYARPH